MKSIKLFFVLLTAVAVAACGSGSGTTMSPLPHTTATMSFSASATGSTLPAPLQGIEMAVKLPKGASIADANVPTAVVGKNGHVPQNVKYDPAINEISFSLIEPEIKLGETFVDVTCAITPDLTPASFTAVNTPLPSLKMYGVNPTNGDSVDLASHINIAMAVALR